MNLRKPLIGAVICLVVVGIVFTITLTVGLRKRKVTKKPTPDNSEIEITNSSQDLELKATPCEAMKILENKTNEEVVDSNEDLQFILNGIQKISIPENVSSDTMTVYSRKAFPILVARANDESHQFIHPIVAAGRYGRGKFAAYGHHSFLIFSNATDYGNGQLLANIAEWEVIDSTKKQHNIGLCVDEEVDIETFQEVFNNRSARFHSTALKCSNNELGNLAYLREYDVILLNGRTEISDNEVKAIRDYVACGGGIILGADSYSTFRRNNTSETSFWGNDILNSIGGVAFSHNALLTTGPQFLNISEMTLYDFKDINSKHANYAWGHFKKFVDDVNHYIDAGNTDIEKYDWKTANQVKSILDARIRSAPKDRNLSSEIIDQIAGLLITRTEYGTVNTSITFLKPFYPKDIWDNIVKSSKGEAEFIHEEKAEEMIDNLKTFISNSTSITYSRILSNMIDKCIKILLFKGTTMMTESVYNIGDTDISE